MLFYKDSNSEYKNDQYYYINDPAVLHNNFPVFTEIKAAYGKKRVPESSTDDCVDRKSNKIHFSRAGGQRDQVTHYGNETANKDSCIAVFIKKTFGGNKIVTV
jgi:hypothetical protein